MIPVPHRIVLLGFGNVGRELARLLLERRLETPPEPVGRGGAPRALVVMVK